MRNIFKCLLIILALTFAASCAATEQPEVIPEFDTGDGTVDFSGVKLRCYMNNEICYEEGSLFGDMAKVRVSDIETKYNVDLEFVKDSFDGNLPYYVSAGLNCVDLANSTTYALYDDIRAGYLCALDAIDSAIDYRDSAKWGSKNQLISFVYDSHIYGVLPMYWPGTIYKQCDHFFFVNEDIVAEIAQPDPREFVEDGTWTRDKYLEILNTYTHTTNSGNLVNALAAKPGHYFSIAIKASGIDYIVKNSDGTYSNAFMTSSAYDKLAWISDTFWQNYGTNIIEGTDTFDTIDKFVKGDTTMVLTHLYYGLEAIQYNVDNFGLLPFPLSDDLQGTGWISQHEFFNNGFFIPVISLEQDAAAFVANELFEPFPGYETEEERYAYYDRYVFHDSRDTRMLFEALANCRYLPFNDQGYLIPNALTAAHGNKSIKQILEENETIMAELIEEVHIPLDETCMALWGEN